MASTQQFQEINNEVKDIINTKFEFSISDTVLVPSYEDPKLTFENGQTKRGKTIETCVLYIDMRNSTALSNTHRQETMGKLYTAFVKAMIYAADIHGGVVRNIIGDRVMVVFPPKDCFKAAVHCAISMNSIASNIINHHFKLNEFKCGIGIDYGSMLVLKTGIAKQGKERTAYKNLVWIGKPANIASKLTDIANKDIRKEFFTLKYSFLNPISRLFGDRTPTYIEKNEVVDVDTLITNLGWSSINKTICFRTNKVSEFKKNLDKVCTPPILMTEKVWQEYTRQYPNLLDVKEKYWKEIKVSAKEYNGKIYGGQITWTSIKNITK